MFLQIFFRIDEDFIQVVIKSSFFCDKSSRMGVDILRFDGFAIRRQKMSKPLCAWGFAIPSNRFGSFVIGGLQIRRDGRGLADSEEKSAPSAKFA